MTWYLQVPRGLDLTREYAETGQARVWKSVVTREETFRGKRAHWTPGARLDRQEKHEEFWSQSGFLLL